MSKTQPNYQTVHITCECDVKFWSYGSAKLDARAKQCIVKHVKELMREELQFIPIHVEHDEEDTTDNLQHVKVRVK